MRRSGRPAAGFALLAACLVALGGAPRPAAAQPPGGPEFGGARRARAERIAQAVARALDLDSAQAARLREVSARFAGERRALARRERDARETLRAELAPGGAPDQERVRAAVDALLDVQRRRVDVLQGEQRELAAFLTPVQRARYLALQERAARAVERARRERGPAGDDSPGAGAMFGPRERRPFR